MVRIDKRIARKVFKAGKDVIAIPHKMNPNSQFYGMGLSSQGIWAILTSCVTSWNITAVPVTQGATLPFILSSL